MNSNCSPTSLAEYRLKKKSISQAPSYLCNMSLLAIFVICHYSLTLMAMKHVMALHEKYQFLNRMFCIECSEIQRSICHPSYGMKFH